VFSKRDVVIFFVVRVGVAGEVNLIVLHRVLFSSTVVHSTSMRVFSTRARADVWRSTVGIINF